jgi:hypothetical protein
MEQLESQLVGLAEQRDLHETTHPNDSTKLDEFTTQIHDKRAELIRAYNDFSMISKLSDES